MTSLTLSSVHIDPCDADGRGRLQGWSLYERRVQREGIFERPFGDDQPIKKLWAYPRFPELRCRRNTTKAA